MPRYPTPSDTVRGMPAGVSSKVAHRIASIEGEVPSLTNRPSGCEFHTRCPVAQERCRSETPERCEIEPGHYVRCHFPLRERTP